MDNTLRTADQRALAIAANQHAAINHLQATGAGLTDRQVYGRLRDGRWRSPTRGVYVVAGSPDTWQQRAMVAFLATTAAGSVVSHVTAAAVYGLLAPSPLPHVTVPPGSSARCRVAKVHRGLVTMQDRQHRDGLVVVTPSRLLVDMAHALSRDALADLTDDILCRRLASHQSVLASMERAGRRRHGHGLLRDVLDVWTPAIEPGSVAEMRLVRRLGELGVTDIALQHEVYDEQGRFVGRLDIVRTGRPKGLEYEGARHHLPRASARDESRYQRLRSLGWEIESVTKADLLPGETRLADIARRWNADRAA